MHFDVKMPMKAFGDSENELLYMKEYATIEAKQDVDDYIENSFKRKRLNSYLGYMNQTQ